jgi:tetratricopeptide (TPR) repeat protein
LLALALALALAPGPGASPAKSQPGKADIRRALVHVRAGNVAQRAGDTKTASVEFEKALDRFPGMPDALIGMGLIAMGDRDYERALAAFEGARDGFTTLSESCFDLAAERYRDAQEEMREIRTDLSSIRVQRHEALGSESGVQTHNPAITAMEARLRTLEAIRPPTESKAREVPGEIYFYIGNALFHLGRIEDARAAWETCAERTPDFAAVHNNLAIAYFKEGRIDEALASLDRAENLGLEVNPQFRAELSAAEKKPPGH